MGPKGACDSDSNDTTAKIFYKSLRLAVIVCICCKMWLYWPAKDFMRGCEVCRKHKSGNDATINMWQPTSRIWHEKASLDGSRHWWRAWSFKITKKQCGKIKLGRVVLGSSGMDCLNKVCIHYYIGNHQKLPTSSLILLLWPLNRAAAVKLQSSRI